MLKRDLSDQESLMRSFNQPKSDDDENQKIDLELKKSFFYVINPEGRIIDCAKIYSFLHELNIFKRITAKVAKDVDMRISAGK